MSIKGLTLMPQSTHRPRLTCLASCCWCSCDGLGAVVWLSYKKNR